MKTSGSQGGEYEDDSLFVCCALLTGKMSLTIQNCLLPSSGR
jgi:hypothetical protein